MRDDSTNTEQLSVTMPGNILAQIGSSFVDGKFMCAATRHYDGAVIG